ncbi:Putative negative regulator of RcsB-dependent stress response [Polynucleobacter meluiroseus]|uniref:Negative regulator of RcsB-dependent stress response n=1 Tax=Polynucleobacter meluiroseus TaxID=1938814 RepID=A0A240E2M9_9BURK|nr:tetratricopeptide repeat protein [Polynucleobacter meluiroseus]SNX29513.1 Putative negative regulator of RcsB-dependent stress response [Polynucleobacter meluiroseus]
MPLDLEEQEQLDQFKAFWQKYRNLITGVLTALLLTYAAYSAYQWWSNSQALAASQLYETMISAINKGDKDQAFLAANDMQKDFSRTPYAAMASLVAAKLASDAGDGAQEMTYLRWTAQHASNHGYQALAKLRLISQLTDQGSAADLAEADVMLKEKPVKGFEALWLERRGDWYLAQKNTQEARSSYEAAWQQLNQTKEFPEEARRLLKVKLDAVGGVAQ